MSDQPMTSTTPDPELFFPEAKQRGEDVQRETAGCSGGLSGHELQAAIRRAAGGGPPGDGQRRVRPGDVSSRGVSASREPIL
jgi:hypothetical protein